MKKTSIKLQKRNRRHAKIRSRISGTSEKPRLSVFRSNTALYAQLIDDAKSHTLASVSTREIDKGTLSEKSFEAGKKIAEKAKEIKISKVAFDRGGFAYRGLIQKLADGAREGGLKF